MVLYKRKVREFLCCRVRGRRHVHCCAATGASRFKIPANKRALANKIHARFPMSSIFNAVPFEGHCKRSLKPGGGDHRLTSAARGR